jgi:hypothetical protein
VRVSCAEGFESWKGMDSSSEDPRATASKGHDPVLAVGPGRRPDPAPAPARYTTVPVTAAITSPNREFIVVAPRATSIASPVLARKARPKRAPPALPRARP